MMSLFSFSAKRVVNLIVILAVIASVITALFLLKNSGGRRYRHFASRFR